jgi:hypothetical protein
VAFPTTPRQWRVELFLNGGWVDVTADVYARDRVQISRGSKDENSSPEPSTCQLTLNNRSGNYSPRNPTGIYYGSIGRNNPIRVTIEQVTDTFTRTVSNGWGSTDTAQAWSTTGVGGTVAASDFAASGGVGTHSVPVAAANRVTYLPTVVYRDVDVAVTVTLPFSSVTGAAVEPANVVLRGLSTSDYYYANVSIAAGNAINVGVLHFDGTVIASAVSTGLTFTGQALRVRAQCEGPILRVKVWAASGVEPYGWTITGRLDSTVRAGFIGVRSGVVTGNTNTKPIVFSYDNLTVRVPRFVGEVSAWPQRWDISGIDIYAPIEAAGVRRRLGQGVSPVRSTLRRFWSEVAPNVVAYWPMEDGKESLSIASGLPAGLPMSVNGTSFDFATYDDLPASASLPTLGNAWLAGNVPSYTPASTVRIMGFLHAPSTPLPDVTVLSQIFFSGTLLAWQITFRNADGALSFEGFNRAGTSVGVLSTGPIAFQLVDTSQLCILELTQNGANIDWTFTVLFLGGTEAAQATGTITGFTFDRCLLVSFDPYVGCKDTAIGHWSVRSPGGPVTNTIASFNAWSGDPATIGGETMGQRIDRLANENGITIGGQGSRSNTDLVGPQRVDTLLNLLDSVAASDLGILTEMKGDSGLAFRTRASLYNQAAALNLNYTGGQVSPPLEPTDDDQQTRNDITAARDGGSDVRAQLLTGRLSVLAPGLGGVGRYDAQTTVSVAYDSQLANIATWLLAAGTTDETRYPTVTVQIENPNVTALDASILDVDIGDRLTISNPKTGQTPDTISQIVRGYTEVIEPFSHTVTFNCSPESPYAVVRLDSAGHKLDSDTSTLVSGVSSSATSLSIATSDAKNLWQTGTVSILIRVAGEAMTVTNISGTTSPQTFTVTRSVNGIVKAQSTGAVVSLFREATLAL